MKTMKESYPLPSSTSSTSETTTLLDLPVSTSIFLLDEKAWITFEDERKEQIGSVW